MSNQGPNHIGNPIMYTAKPIYTTQQDIDPSQIHTQQFVYPSPTEIAQPVDITMERMYPQSTPSQDFAYQPQVVVLQRTQGVVVQHSEAVRIKRRRKWRCSPTWDQWCWWICLTLIGFPLPCLPFLIQIW